MSPWGYDFIKLILKLFNFYTLTFEITVYGNLSTLSRVNLNSNPVPVYVQSYSVPWAFRENSRYKDAKSLIHDVLACIPKGTVHIHKYSSARGNIFLHPLWYICKFNIFVMVPQRMFFPFTTLEKKYDESGHKKFPEQCWQQNQSEYTELYNPDLAKHFCTCCILNKQVISWVLQNLLTV